MRHGRIASYFVYYVLVQASLIGIYRKLAADEDAIHEQLLLSHDDGGDAKRRRGHEIIIVNDHMLQQDLLLFGRTPKEFTFGDHAYYNTHVNNSQRSMMITNKTTHVNRSSRNPMFVVPRTDVADKDIHTSKQPPSSSSVKQKLAVPTTNQRNSSSSEISYPNLISSNVRILNYKWKQHPFWRKLMADYCKTIYYHQHKLKTSSNYTGTNDVSVIVNFTVDCIDPFHTFGLGTGNIVMAIYGLRLAANANGADFWFQCRDVALQHPRKAIELAAAAAETKKQHLRRKLTQQLQPFIHDVLPWLQGYYVAPQRNQPYEKMLPWTRFDPPIPDPNLSCKGYQVIPLHYMADAIREDMQTLAVSLLGAPRTTILEPAQDTTARSVVPIIPELSDTVDDVAIHFRCGDILGISTDSYGMVEFDVYRQYISPQARTIGIVTQSFDPQRNRVSDQNATVPCRYLVLGLQRYIQQHFPTALVSIRNGKHETTATAYARLVLANQSFSGLSSFSSFASIATFGTAYIPQGRVTYFCPPIADRYDNVNVFSGQILTSKKMRSFKHLSEVLLRLSRPPPEKTLMQKSSIGTGKPGPL